MSLLPWQPGFQSVKSMVVCLCVVCLCVCVRVVRHWLVFFGVWKSLRWRHRAAAPQRIRTLPAPDRSLSQLTFKSLLYSVFSSYSDSIWLLFKKKYIFYNHIRWSKDGQMIKIIFNFNFIIKRLCIIRAVTLDFFFFNYCFPITWYFSAHYFFCIVLTSCIANCFLIGQDTGKSCTIYQ